MGLIVYISVLYSYLPLFLELYFLFTQFEHLGLY
jgi:hypothetical protein